MGVIKFDRDFETLFNWDTDENPTTEQDYQNAVKNWTETEMNIVDTLLWQPTTEYATGNIVKTPSLPSQYVLRCTETGTSGSTEPSYSGASVGDTVTDGTVEWVIVSLATGNAADVDAGNIGVNAEVDNSEAWASAIGGGAIAEDDGRLVKGDTVYAVTSVMETNIATNTEAIEDNTEAIATNTANIEASAVKIDIDDKRITNIEKLLQGNLYDYQTDTDSKYTKTVLAGAMPYASLDSVGGKTLVWNQLVNPNSIVNRGYISSVGLTLTKNNDGSITVDGTSSNANNLYFYNTLPTINGHKYFVATDKYSTNGEWSISIQGYNVTTANGAMIFTSVENATYAVIRLNFNANVTFNNLTIYPKITDLTLAFGSGNEPTADEFIAMFPNYANESYNAGTLLSAGVTEVVSKGKNLADYSGGQGYPSNTATSNTTKRIFTIGKWIVGIDRENYYYGGNVTATITDNQITVTRTGGSAYGVGIPFACEQGVTYTASAVGSIASGNYARIGLSWYTNDGTWISGNFANTSPYTATAPSGAVQGLIVVFPSAQNVTATYTNIQLEVGSTATSYAPYVGTIATYPIPAEIQALEGYGWSAGTVSNYIDYEAKKFVKCVGAVDLGSLTYSRGVSSVSGLTYFDNHTITNKKVFPQNQPANLVCAKFIPTADNKSAPAGSPYGVMYSLDAYLTLYADYPDVPTFQSAMSGVMLYYELATPIEVDISAYLTDDNLINAEAGGTLTFPNSNGDDYRINVPSAETYMIDLQASL